MKKNLFLIAILVFLISLFLGVFVNFKLEINFGLFSQKSQFGNIFASNIQDSTDFTQIIFDKNSYFLKTKILAKNVVKNPHFANVENDYKGTKDSDIGIYYFKNLSLEKDQKFEIVVNQSWARTNIFIDDNQVLSSEHSTVKEFFLRKGKHKIEIDFLAGNNNGHDIEFYEAVDYLTLKNRREQMPNFLEDCQIDYVGINENNKEGLPTDLVIKDEKPKILIITSYNPVKINLKDEFNSVKYILMSSYSMGSRVFGSSASTFYLQKNEIENESKLQPTCYFPNSLEVYNHCESKGFFEVAKKIETIFGKKPSSFSGEYNPKEIVVPSQIMDENEYLKLGKKYKLQNPKN